MYSSLGCNHVVEYVHLDILSLNLEFLHENVEHFFLNLLDFLKLACNNYVGYLKQAFKCLVYYRSSDLKPRSTKLILKIWGFLKFLRFVQINA